jgi:hypothetical protein
VERCSSMAFAIVDFATLDKDRLAATARP